MFSLRLALTLMLCVSITSHSSDVSTLSDTKETRVVAPETGQVSIVRGNHEPIKSLTYEESIIPNSWIVELKEQPLYSYRKVVKKQIITTKSNNSSSQKRLKSLLATHKQKLKKQQDSFIQYAKSNNLISGSSMQLTGISNAIVLSASKEDIQILKRHPEVVKVHQNRRYQPTLSESVQTIRADKVWELTDSSDNNITGKGVKIAILDTGIDYTQEDLGGCFGPDCKVAGGYDVYNDDDDPFEDEELYTFIGHGTYVAGVVAANGYHKGVAPDATLYVYKVCGVDLCSSANIIKGLELAVDPDQNPSTEDSVDIINLSLGSQFGDTDDIVPTTINNLVNLGVVVVASAGNDGSFASIGGIAATEKAITVGSSSEYGLHVSEFSSRGPLRQQDYLKPDILAPGDNIRTVCHSTHNWSRAGEGRSASCPSSGTSFSAPHVAGVAALLIQAKPDITPIQVKSALVNTAQSLNDESSAAQGAGLIDALKALQSSLSIQPSIIFFGNLDKSVSIWEQTIELSISNPTASEKLLSLSDVEINQEGVTINFDSADITIAPFSTHILPVSISIDNSTFKLLDRPTLTVDYKLELTEEEMTYTVPLAFSTMSELSVNFQNGWPADVYLFNLKGTFYKETAFSEYYMPSGNYGLIASYTDLGKDQFILMSDIDVSSSNHIAVNPELATHELKLTNILNEDGGSIATADLRANLFLDIRHPLAKYYQHFHYEGPYNSPLFFNTSSEDFEIRLSGLYLDQSSGSKKQINIYTLWDSLTGISESNYYELNPNGLIKQDFIVEEPVLLNSGLSFTVRQQSVPIPDFNGGTLIGAGRGKGFSYWLNESETIFTEPFIFSFYATPRSDSTATGIGIFGVGVDDSTSSRGVGQGISSTNIIFSDDNKMKAVKNVDERSLDRHYDLELFSTSSTSIYLDGSGIVGSSLAEYSYWSNTLKFDSQLWVNDLASYVTGLSEHHTSHFLSYYYDKNEYYSSKEYNGYCDGELVPLEEGVFRNIRSCSEVLLEMVYGSRLRDAEYQSTLSTTVPIEKLLDSNPNVKSALIHNIYVEQNSAVISRPNLQGATLVAQINHDKSINVTIEIKHNDKWQSLDVIQRQNRYEAQLPMPEKARVTHIRVSATDELGVNITNTMTGALVLGKNQNTVFTDDFDLDGIPDYKDMDDDNDGIEDLEDDFVLDVDEYMDTDSDGVGNNADTDDDNDNVEDSVDAFPLNKDETIDTDGDGTGNNADTDDDNDNVEDSVDAFPLNKDETIDTDGDGTGNNADTDDDNDNVEDNVDAFPLNKDETIDTDGDGTGNNADTDDDNDNVEDRADAFPLNKDETIDTDVDGIGNNADTDDDGDGVLDTQDAFPLDSNRSAQPTQPSTPSTNGSSSDGGGGSLYWLVLLGMLSVLVRARVSYYNRPK